MLDMISEGLEDQKLKKFVRIAAIRETFEESGVLLLQPDSQDNVLSMEASKQGSLVFSKFQFSIKPDLRGLSFS